MRITSIEKLMNSVDDGELLDIYTEIESGKVPSTSYAHDFCRKVNRMIDDGELSVKQDGFRHIYLPSLRKLVFKEMARRYAGYLMYKAPDPAWKFGDAGNLKPLVSEDTDEEDVCKCNRCNGEYDSMDLIPTDLGWLCPQCIKELRSNDESVTVYK
jgi:hypothetical protein